MANTPFRLRQHLYPHLEKEALIQGLTVSQLVTRILEERYQIKPHSHVQPIQKVRKSILKSVVREVILDMKQKGEI